MSIIQLYSIAAIGFTIVMTIFVLNPLLVKAQNEKVDNIFTREPTQILFFWQLTNLVLFPVLLIILIAPRTRKKFLASMYQKVFSTK